jgi:hypothetical protein
MHGANMKMKHTYITFKGVYTGQGDDLHTVHCVKSFGYVYVKS